MTYDVCGEETYLTRVSYVPIQLHSSYAKLICKTRLISMVLCVLRNPVTLLVVMNSMMRAGARVGRRATQTVGRLVPVTVALVRCS